jgi:hypothetical protein
VRRALGGSMGRGPRRLRLHIGGPRCVPPHGSGPAAGPAARVRRILRLRVGAAAASSPPRGHRPHVVGQHRRSGRQPRALRRARPRRDATTVTAMRRRPGLSRHVRRSAAGGRRPSPPHLRSWGGLRARGGRGTGRPPGADVRVAVRAAGLLGLGHRRLCARGPLRRGGPARAAPRPRTTEGAVRRTAPASSYNPILNRHLSVPRALPLRRGRRGANRDPVRALGHPPRRRRHRRRRHRLRAGLARPGAGRDADHGDGAHPC